MLKIDPNKTKNITMAASMENIENSKVDFEFIIEMNKIKYSFPVSYSDKKLNVEIPALNEVVNKKLYSGKHNVYIEAKIQTEDKKGHYIRPWNDTILIESEPNVTISMKEKEISESDIKINIGEEIFEQINKIETNKPIVEEKIINKTETKKSKIKNIFS